MLLNFYEGTLTLYNNSYRDRRLGVMKDGLSGLYCWYVRVWDGDDAATIKRDKPPRVDSIVFMSS